MSPEDLPWTIILSIIDFLGCIGNLLVLVTVSRNRELRKRHVTIFIVSLVAADGLQCLLVYPLTNVPNTNPAFVTFYELIGRATHFISVNSLLFLNIDRYLYIASPFWYNNLHAKDGMRKCLCALIAVLWFVGFLWGFTVLIDRSVMGGCHDDASVINELNYTWKLELLEVIAPSVLYILPLTICLILSILVFKVAYQSCQKLLSTSGAREFGWSTRKNIKYTRTLWSSVLFALVATICRFTLVCPYWVAKIVVFVNRTRNHEVLCSLALLHVAYSSLNPLVILSASRHHRRELATMARSVTKKLCCCVGPDHRFHIWSKNNSSTRSTSVDSEHVNVAIQLQIKQRTDVFTVENGAQYDNEAFDSNRQETEIKKY